MMDHMIRELCKRHPLVTPYDPEMINPASLDLRLGDHLKIEGCETDFVKYSLEAHSEENPYLLKPGQFVLAPSLEIINLPRNVTGEVKLKSTRARQGLEHLNAGFCDPGWKESVLTMELKNMRQLRDIPLWPGMRIVQLVLTLSEAMPDRDYSQTGRYNGDQGAQEAKP